jgi:hypothetical protein
MRSQSRRRAHDVHGLAILAAATLVVGLAAAAHADALRCERTVAKASAAFAQVKMKVLQKCEDQVVTHRSSGPCPDAAAAARIAKAESKLRLALSKDCGGGDRTCGAGGDDEALGGIGWSGGACPNFEHGSCANAVTDCNGVSDCLVCVDEAAVDQAIGLYYGGADLGTSNPAVLKCQRAIGTYTAKFFETKSKALQRCEDGALTGSVAGSCPDAARAAPAIAKAESKKRAGICKSCGGADRLCGTSDDLTPATIGFASSCPNVTIPGGASCGGAVTNLSQLVDCVDCVSEFKVDCLDALAAPTRKSYPAECNGGAGPAATPTPDGSGPAVTPTPGGPCILPNPIPEVLSFVGKPGVDLDTGWTGQAHDLIADDAAPLSAARLSNCDTNTASPTCGQCTLDGPVLFPGAVKNCFCYNLADRDASSFTTCDPEAPSTCSGSGESCQCFYGPPLPVSSGGVPVCIVNRYTAALTGTANIADSGPHPGEGAAVVHLEAAVYNGSAVEQPCPVCRNDPTPRDGVRGGTCSGGVRNGQPCDVQGDNEIFGPMSLDCEPSRAANVGNLNVVFDTATTGTTMLGTGPKCTAPNFTSRTCFCDTCATAAAEPCNSNADCPGGAACGGKRCIGGTNVGRACTTISECPSGSCGRSGQATRPNDCSDVVCSPDTSDPNPNDGICEAGPFDRFCSTERFRGCSSDTDCMPPPAGNCGTCKPNQTCVGEFRNCFLDPIVRTGTPGLQNAVLAATFCIAPTTSSAINTVAGLPGPGALALPVRIFKSGAQCGNGVVNSGEQCDGANDSACPGACLPNCQCPKCGDQQVNRPGEQCDGVDDSACPGQCQANCTCAAVSCGDGVTQVGEECDGADDAACPGHCQSDCTCGPFCGDGIVNGSEQCDGAASGGACPASACQANCTCGPFCGNNQIDPGEECDGNGTGTCLGTCQGDCQCAPVCGDNHRQTGELCDGTDDSLCPGQCSANCTCPARGNLTLTVVPGADLDTGWTGIAHDFGIQAGSTISGEISGCDGVNDFDCDFFGNVGSYCSGDPTRSCTDSNQCSGAGNCVISTFGPPLPLSAGGVPACLIDRFATDVTGTYNLQTGAMALNLHLNALVHLGNTVTRPCPICDCGQADPQNCHIGDAGTCSDITGSPPCHVQGTGPLGPTSNECPPSSSLNVSGGGLDIPFTPITTGTVSFATNQPCTGSGFTNQSCWCSSELQPSSCLNACDGGSRDAQPCDTDADCGGVAGSCKPLCRQVAGDPVGEARCAVGPVDQTCSNAPEVGCQTNSDCAAGQGTCVAKNRRCFLDPIVRVGTPSTTLPVGAATFCIPATTGTAINQTAGLPGPGAIRFQVTSTVRRCGDNVINQTSEECDGDDDANCPGSCLGNCQCNRTCGNNVVEFGEQCDGTSSSACPGQCGAPGSANECECPAVCGDGFLASSEQCDPGGVNGASPSDAACPGACGANCQCTVAQAQCLNNILDPGEACEEPAIGCGPSQVCLACNQCFPPPDIIPPSLGFVCGNGNIEPGEVCELPAVGCGTGQICVQCTQCAQTPLPPVCGNGSIETGEACELPAVGCGPFQLCLLCGQCVDLPVHTAVCGNGVIEPGEACELPQHGCGPLSLCVACQQCMTL